MSKKRLRASPTPHAPTKAAMAIVGSRSTVKVSTWLPPDLLDDAKNAVDALSGPPLRLTFTALLTEAVTRELARLRKQHHEGRPFPKRPSSTLRSGPRAK